MIGRSFAQDSRWPVLDPRTLFGAQAQYGQLAARPFREVPQNLLPQGHAPSEHFIGNMPLRIVVAQLAGQTSAADLNRRISFRAFLKPGNQSIGGT